MVDNKYGQKLPLCTVKIDIYVNKVDNSSGINKALVIYLKRKNTHTRSHTTRKQPFCMLIKLIHIILEYKSNVTWRTGQGRSAKRAHGMEAVSAMRDSNVRPIPVQEMSLYPFIFKLVFLYILSVLSEMSKVNFVKSRINKLHKW